MTRKCRVEYNKDIAEREKPQTRVRKKGFSVKLIEKQQLEGRSTMCSDIKNGCYEIREGTVHYYESFFENDEDCRTIIGTK